MFYACCGILRGRFKVPLYSVFAVQAQDMTSQALYLRYSAYDVIVYVRSQTLYLRYSACGIILETKVTFMMESTMKGMKPITVCAFRQMLGIHSLRMCLLSLPNTSASVHSAHGSCLPPTGSSEASVGPSPSASLNSLLLKIT